MPTQAAPLGLRLFLEGIEVPVIAAQVNIQPNNPASASIQIVPTDSVQLFLPRTLVHLFFLDDELTAADRDLADRLEQERRIDRFEVEDSRYRLLFAGEVVGLGYQKTTATRSAVLQCLDLSSYWDTCYQWFADFSVGGSGFTDKTHQFVGAGEYLFNNIASGTRWVIGGILGSRPENPAYRDTTGLLGGYIHLLESIGGIRPKAGSYDGFRGVNDFFTVAELRYGLTAMIGAVAKDKTSQRLYKGKAFRNWLMNGMASAGSLVSYRDVLRLVGKYIFHDVYPNPAAYFVRGGDVKQIVIPRSFNVAKLGKDLLDLLQPILDTLSDAQANFSAIGDDSLISYANGRDPVAGALRDLQTTALPKAEALTSTDKPQVVADLLLAINSLNATVRRIKTFAGDPVGSLEDRIGTAQGMLIATLMGGAVRALDKLLTSTTKKKSFKREEVVTSDRLFNQLLLPETFFVSPPRCNVLFPDQVTQFSYTRNFLREVSRLSCQGGLGIIGGGGRGGGVLGRHYFAPNISDVRGKLARRTVYKTGTTILPHEVHSGIIPKFEWVTDGHRWGLQAAKEAKENVKERKINYIQRLANFQFFMHRWNSRTMSASGRFNPMLVLGFPGVVIDRSTPAPAALEAISSALGTGKAILPTAYIGKISALSHSITQQGGVTSVAYRTARTHRSFDDEFLGVVQRENQEEEQELAFAWSDLIEAQRAGTGADEVEKKIAQAFLAGGTTVSISPGLVITKIKDGGSGDTFILFREDATSLGVSDSVFDNFFKSANGGDSPDGDPFDSAEVPASIDYTEVIIRARGSFISPEGGPAPETIIKPGWYAPSWSRVKISDDVYLPLLGTVAITDDSDVGADAEQFTALLTRFFTEAAVGLSATVVAEGTRQVVQVAGKTIASFEIGVGTVEQSIDGLTMLYGLVKKKGLPAAQFIGDYTRRPIATLTEILGSSNLKFDADGEVEDPETQIEGFHSRAFGDYNTNVRFPVETGTGNDAIVAGDNAFFALLPTPRDGKGTLVSRSITNKGKNLPDIPKYLDPRGRSWTRVNAYMEELRLSRGLAAE